MIKWLAFLFLAFFGTTILIYAVIEHEPPAFIAYAFGVITGLCWAGIVGLWWLRQDAQAEEDYRDCKE